MRQRYDSLIGQIVAANVVLVALTVVAAALVGGLDSGERQGGQVLILVLVIVLSFCVNLWMLQRRFRPLEALIERVERIDPAEPATFEIYAHPVEEIDRLAKSFHRMLGRVDEERRRSGKLVVRAQEEERGRVARDLHDEVNQALTAILLRLEALAQDVPRERAAEVAEIKRLASQAMDELLGLARQLRPTALDDHGLIAAIEAQLSGFRERTGIDTRLEASGEPGTLDVGAVPSIILVVGVNGTGKTTTIGKLAQKLREHKRSVLLGAADTFRAAAGEQLEIWAERAGADFVGAARGADPAAVAFDTVEAARARGHDVAIVDTAGRLHTQSNLMEELAKVRRVIEGRLEGAPHETLLVIDATTGQNGLQQARLFGEAAKVTGVALTKLDGSAKGGIAVAIAYELGLPVKLIGVGEGLDDLRPFDPQDFARALVAG